MSLAEQLKRMQQMMTMGYDGYFAQKNAEQARINQANREINDRMTAAFAATPEPERLSIAPEVPSAQQPLQLSEAQYQAIFGEQAAQTQAVSEQPQQKEILTYTDSDYGIERSYLPFEQVATAAAKAYNWASDADYEAGKANVEAARNLGAVPDTLIRLAAGDEKAIESAKSGLANIDEHIEVGGHGIKRAWNDRQTEAVKNAVKDAMQEDLRALTLKGLYQSPEHKALRETIFDFDWQWDNFIRDAQRGAVDIGGADPEAYFNEQHGQNWWQRTVGDITGEDFRALNQRMKTAFEHYVQHGNTAGRTLIPAINERGKVLVENRVKLRDYEDAAEAARNAEAVKAKMGDNPNKHDYRYDAAFKLGDGVASSAPALIAGAGTMGLTRNPALASKVASGFMAAPVAGRAYHDARVAGASPNRATVYAAIYAAAEYLPEKVALNKFFSGMGQKWYKQVLRQAGVEFLQEGITETAQVLADKGVLHQDITLGEAVHRIAEAAVLGGTIGGLMGGASAAMAGAAERLSTANPSTQPSNNANNRSSANPSNSTAQSGTSPASSTSHSQAAANNSTMQPLLSPEELAALRTINPTDATTVELMQERFANEPNMSSARRETLNKQLENIRNRHSEAIAKEIQSAMAADIEISGEVAHQIEDFIANAEAQSLSLVNAPKAPAPELSELPQEIQDFLNGESTDTAEEAQTAPITETVAQIDAPQSNTVQPSPAIQAHGRAFSEAAFAELEAINPEEAETVALAQEAIDAIAANPRIEAQDKQERIEPLQQGIAEIFARNHVAPLPAQASHSADNAQAIEPLSNTSPLPIVEAAMDEVSDAAALAAATQAEMAREAPIVFGERAGLFDLAPIVVSEIAAQELNFNDTKKLADAILQQLQSSGQLRNDDSGWTLQVSRLDRKKMGKNTGLSHSTSQAVQGIRDLVKHAVVAETHPDILHKNPDVRAVHRLYAPALINGQLHRVKLTVKDYVFTHSSAPRKNLHAIEAVEIENALLGTLPSYSASNDVQTAQPTTERRLSVADLLRGVKHDGDDVLFGGQEFVSNVNQATAETEEGATQRAADLRQSALSTSETSLAQPFSSINDSATEVQTQINAHESAQQVVQSPQSRALTDEEMEAQYRPVLDAMLGKQVSQLIVLSNTMPNGAALEGEGLYDRKSGKLHLNANRVSEYALNGNVLLTAEQRLAWVAWHELFHRGLARAQGYVLRGDKPFKDLLKEARRNPFVAQLAKAIQAERKAQVDTNLAPQGALIHSEDIATEEALAEIAAAIQSDKMNALIERYKPYAKLGNPPSYKALENLVERMIEIMRRLLALVARGGKVIDSASDEEIIQALRTVLAFNFDSLVPQESELPHPNAPLDKSNPRLNLYDAPVNAYDAHDDAGKESPLKKAFTNNAKMFLEAVEKHLAQAGFAPIPSKRKSKKAKAVSLNWGGVAVSGDVSLRMQDADGLQIYATINADSLMGGGDYYTNLMYRLENIQDGQTLGSNHWYPLGEDNNTAQQVAEALLEMYRTYQQSNSNKGQANATLEESATEDENNGRAEQYQTTDEAGTVSPLSAGSTEAGRRRFGSDTTDSGGDLGGSDKLVSGVRDRTGHERERSDDVGERLHEAGVSGGSRDAGVHDGNAARDGVEQDDTDNWQENYQEDSDGVYELGEFVPSFDELMAQEESRELSGADTDAVPDFSKPARPSEPVAGENHRINPADLLAQGDWFARAQANVEAIRLAKRLKAENALPNEEQRKALARFTGWGASAFNKLFDERKQPMIWKALNAQLREITTQEEYDYILRSTQYAHYTSPEIVQAIYQGLARLGFNGGRVLEPASGVGIFNGLMPDEMAHSSHYTGVEIDAITGLIAQLLYPQSEMRIGDFTQWRLPRKAPKYDVVVGNPPFADIVVQNAVAHKDARLHDFFFLHSMDALREGGVMAFITSTGTMDKTGEKVRAKLAEQADLLAAFRLPNTAFAEAGTEAVTDILFLQKRGVGQESNGNAWRSIKGIKLDGQSFALNEYYHQHPSHILGELKVVSSAHGAKLTVASNGRELAELLTEAMQSLPQNVFAFEGGSMAQAAEVLEADFAPTSAENAPTRLGAVFVANGNLMRVNEYGEAMPLTHRYSNGKEIALKDSEKNFLKDYVGLRDAVLQAQRDQLTAKPDETYWQQSLAALQKNYRAFVKKHGRLLAFTEHERIAQVKQEDGSVVEESVVSTRHKNRHLLSLDAQSFVVSAIEKVTPERSKNGEAVIVDGAFLGDTRSLNAPQPPVIENAFDAMMVAMSERGRTDVARAAALLGVSEAQIVAELGDRIYQNPFYTEDNQADKWIFADEYLTGDVVEKLKAAKAKARENAAFERNVLALEAVIPTPIPADEIAMRLGANWIPEGVYQQFVQEVLQSRVMKFHYHRATGQWSVNGGSIDAAFSSEYFKDNEFIEKVLNNKEISVKRRLPDDTYYIDVNATASANLKADLIKERFSTWALEDSSRAQRLAEIYNERFNNIVPPQYDGSHLRLVGASNKVELRPHQKNAVYRITRSGDTYLNHTVGAGKTFTMIAAAMEERRLGLIKKPMFVVPNHMLMQFSNEFLQLYPSADLMIADEENFAAHNRKLFVAQAAMNNPDAIIITHSAFSRIGVSLKTQQEFIEDELAALAQTIAMVEQVEGRKSLSLKQWQKVKQRKEEQLKALLSAERKDNHISFEELGVDRLYIDEAHEFRKLSFATAMNRIRGIDPNGSQKAADLMMKLRDLRRGNPDNQRTVVFASGTPVTNTMGELYTVLRYFRPQMLEKDDTAFFDSWARQFGEVVEDVEMDASGDYKAVKRFAKFVNIPELMRRVLDFMDVVSSQDLSAYVSRPEIKGGERQIIITEESEQFKGFQNTLRDRMAKIKNRGGKPEKGADIMLNVIGDGRLGALDLRFIDNTLPPDYDNKVNRLIADVAQVYKESADFEYFDDSGKVEPIKGAAIVVFSDLGFGKAVAQSRGFDLRKWTFDELLRLGVDKNHIAFIDDFNTNAKKRALFEDMKQGRKRILIGGKGMETGMNIQKRLKYLFHLDAPWFPSSMEQREGRIIRQGNQNKQVDIRAYATYGSYDSAMWATLARKARFIEQIFSGDFSQRSMEDVGQASQFEEAAAMVSNDPNAQKLNELKKRVDKLEREERGYLDEQRKQKARIKEVQGQIDWAKGRLVAITDALQKYKPLNADNFSGVVLGKKYHKRAEFGEALLKAFDKRRIGAAGVQKLAEVGGYEIQLRLTSDGRAFLDIAIPYKNVEPLIAADAFEKATPSGLPTKIENRISALPVYQETMQAMLEKAERDLISLEAAQGKVFPRAEELAQARQDLSVFEQEITNAAKSVQEAAVQEAKEQEQYSISPMKSVQANIARGREAMNRAIVGKTDVHRAMYRQGLGWVDFVWGDVGVLLPSGKTKRAMGIAHIIESRMRKDDMNYGEAVQMLTERVVNTIAKGEESRIYESNDGKNKSVFIEHDGNRATLVQRKGSNVWLMNAFELHPTDEQGVSNDTVLPTQSKPTRQRHGLGAVGENSLNPNAAAVNPVSPLGTEIRGAAFQVDENGDVLYSIAPSALLENARPRRSAKSFDEVRAIASEMVGKPLSNKATGMVATISNRSLDKLTSGKAASQSSSRKDHMIAVANIDQLFENAIEGWSEPAKTAENVSLKAAHKMFAPLQIDADMKLVKLTVKEFNDNSGNRIYSVETIEVGNEDGTTPELSASVQSERTLDGLRSANVNSLIQAIADFNRSSRLQAPAGMRLDDGEFQSDESGEVLYSIAPIDYVRTKVMRHEIFTGEGFKRLMLDRMRELERIKEVLNDEQMDSVMNAFRSFNGRVNHELERDINPLLERWGKQVLPKKALELRRKIPKYQGMSKAGAAAQLMTDLDAIISFVLHGEERNMVIAAKLKAQGKQLDEQDYAGSGMTDAEIADLRALYESDDFGNGLLIDYAQEFYQTEVKPLLEQSKQKLRDAGLLTPEMEQKFPTYEYYVPLYGAPTAEEQIEQAIIRDYAPRLSDEALKNVSHSAKGRRGTKAHSIFETLITQAKIAANRSQMQQNKERLWHLLSESEAAREEFQAKLSIHHAKDIEVDVVDEYGGAEHITIRKDGKHEGSNLRQIVWQQGNVFYVMEIGNERALDAIRNINRNAVKNPLIRAIGALTRWSASWFTVKNITWQPVNKIRDSMDMFHYILADAPLGEMNDLHRSAVALKAAWLNTRYTATGGWDSGFKYWLEEYASLGGVTSYNELLGMNQLEELERMVKRKARGYSVNVARVYGNLTARLSLFLEMTTRVSAYRALVEAGVAQEEAAMYVKNVMNFETKGDLAANMGAFYMFFTSAIYGSARLLSSLKTRRGWISLTMLTAFSLAVKQVIRGLLPKDDEGKTCLDRYDAVSSTNFVIFPVLSEDGVMRCEGVRLPVSFGYGRLSNGIASGLDRLLHGGEVEDFISDTLNGVIIDGLSPISPTARSWADDPVGALTDTVMPSAVKPLLQFTENKNFRGGKIYDDSPYRAVGELDYNSGFDGTRDSEKALARWIYDTVGWDIHPETIAHFGRSYMNGLYEPLMDAAEMVIDRSGEGRLSVGSDLSHMPFVNRFRQKAPSDLATDYFRERDEAKDAFNRYADAAMRGKAFTHEKQQAAVKSQANAMLFKAADAALKKVRQERKSMREQAQLAKDAAKAGLNGDALTQRLQEINRQQQVAERRYHDTINVIYRRAVKQSEGLNDD